MQLDNEEIGILVFWVLLGAVGLTLCVLYLNSLSLGIGLGILCFFVCLAIGIAIVAQGREQFACCLREAAKQAQASDTPTPAVTMVNRPPIVVERSDTLRMLDSEVIEIQRLKCAAGVDIRPPSENLFRECLRLQRLIKEIRDISASIVRHEGQLNITQPAIETLLPSWLSAPDFKENEVPTDEQEIQAVKASLTAAYDALNPCIDAIVARVEQLKIAGRAYYAQGLLTIDPQQSKTIQRWAELRDALVARVLPPTTSVAELKVEWEGYQRGRYRVPSLTLNIQCPPILGVFKPPVTDAERIALIAQLNAALAHTTKILHQERDLLGEEIAIHDEMPTCFP